MKKFAGKFLIIILSLILVSFVFSSVPFKASAQIDYDCVREKLLAGEDVSECSNGGDGTGEGSGINTNFFGVELSPDQEGVARVVRSGITVAFGLLVVLAVFYGIYGIFVRSTAGDNEDKMKESVNIFKNAILGLVITIVGFIVVEILSLLLGLGNIWEITFQGRMVGALADCQAEAVGDRCIVRNRIPGTGDFQYCTYDWNGNTWVPKGCRD